MKIKSYSILITSIFIFVAVLSATFYSTSDSPRTTELFTDSWLFNFGDVRDGQNPSLDDSH